jgi:predicted SAM-dependent methyltransferase
MPGLQLPQSFKTSGNVMPTREYLVQMLKRVQLDGFVKFCWHAFCRMGRIIVCNDRRITRNYFASKSAKKLHIGSGAHHLVGWLNTDLYPQGKNTIYLDATKVFPFNESTFDYVFSEHMIEHIPYPDGLWMLAECYRVLKPNGKIRIACPDLKAIIDFYNPKKTSKQLEYIRWTVDKFTPGLPYEDTFVINDFFRNWGHQFLYDEKTMRSAMETIGFENVIRKEMKESNDSQLKGLEHEKRMPDGLLALVSMALEGTKPA